MDTRSDHRGQHQSDKGQGEGASGRARALQGGSSVVAALLHRAIGEQLTCVFVDNGLLHLHEGDQVTATFAGHMKLELVEPLRELFKDEVRKIGIE